MATFKHPGIDMVEKLRERGDRTDEQIKGLLRTEKSALNIAMERTAQDNPANLKAEDIQILRKYEVALAYIDIMDLDNKTATNRLRCAINGISPTEQPNDSTRYAARKECALNPKPDARVAITLDF